MSSQRSIQRAKRCAQALWSTNICGSKWVDKVKPDGSLKSRLVVQGFTQVWLKDYHDTFSAVASMTTFRILINVSAILGWDIFTIDVSQAYTQGDILKQEMQISVDPNG